MKPWYLPAALTGWIVISSLLFFAQHHVILQVDVVLTGLLAFYTGWFLREEVQNATNRR